MTSAGPLSEALALTEGLVCAVGAGGKKTGLYRLAAEHADRALALTGTVATPGSPRVRCASCMESGRST